MPEKASMSLSILISQYRNDSMNASYKLIGFGITLRRLAIGVSFSELRSAA
jgi:hypothetical protein